MTTATLSGVPATQLTFPWLQGEEDGAIVAESMVSPSAVVEITNLPPQAAAIGTAPVESRVTSSAAAVEEVAPSLTAALQGDRIGRPFKMGSVMFRLLKSYGITDEEIAAGVAAYNARKAAAVA